MDAPEPIRQTDWIGHFGRAADDCFIFDLVIYNGVTRLFDPQPFVKVLLKLRQTRILADKMHIRPQGHMQRSIMKRTV